MHGVSLLAVKELLGHQRIDMTFRYAHLSLNVSRSAVRLRDAPSPDQARGTSVEQGP